MSANHRTQWKYFQSLPPLLPRTEMTVFKYFLQQFKLNQTWVSTLHLCHSLLHLFLRLFYYQLCWPHLSWLNTSCQTLLTLNQHTACPAGSVFVQVAGSDILGRHVGLLTLLGHHRDIYYVLVWYL